MAIEHREELKSLDYARNRWILRNDNGKPVNESTVARWVRQGIQVADGKSIRLEVHFRGSRPMTSREAVSRFIDAVTNARLNKVAAIKANSRLTLSEFGRLFLFSLMPGRPRLISFLPTSLPIRSAVLLGCSIPSNSGVARR